MLNQQFIIINVRFTLKRFHICITFIDAHVKKTLNHYFTTKTTSCLIYLIDGYREERRGEEKRGEERKFASA